MPDLKISQLPVASTPLAGTELVPIVQGGTTDQTTVQAILTSAVPSGTANGVLYLNGSKVVTSGSALTFDGTTLGVGASGGGYRIAATAATNLAAFSDGSTQNLFLTVTGGSGSAGAFTFNANNGGALVWQNAGAEQMRLTSTGLGIGTSSPSSKLEVRNDVYATISLDTTAIKLYNNLDGGSGIEFSNGVGGKSKISLGVESSGGGTDDTYIGFSTCLNAGSLTEHMRLDFSGNLGIGTSSPSRKLDVQGAPVSVGGNGTGVLANFVNNTTAFNASPTAAISLWNRFNSGGTTFPSAVVQGGKENTTDGNFAGYLSLQTTDAVGTSNEQMRLDSSGNLGLGVTPSAWNASYKALDISSAAAITASGSDILSVSNAFLNVAAGWIYKATGAASFSRQTGGAHQWFTAPSGTAGNVISFTQALTLDVNRNLALNTTSVGTSAVGALSIGSGTEPSSGPADTVQLYSVDRSAGNTIPAFYCEGTGVTDAGITNTTVTHKIAMKINGTVYYLLATTNAT